MQIGDFNYWFLPEQNINFYNYYTDTFKTDFVKIFFPIPLEKDIASLNALLPFVLFRGTQNYPETIDLVRSLEALYGTEFTIDVEKRGEWQIVEFGLEVVAEKYLPKGTNILARVLKLLAEIIYKPYVLENKFLDKYVDSEKRTLLEDIKYLKDDKMAYSMERCLQEMYNGEPFSIYKYGDYDEMMHVNNDLLFNYHSQFTNNSPMHIFYVGRNNPDYLMKLIADLFPIRTKSENNRKLTNSIKKGSEKIIIEEDHISQGRLTIGYRTEINRASPKFPHLWVANGIWGGFPHSRLFRHIREEKGLAYYISSNLESTKGLLTVFAGIESDYLEETVDSVNKHLDDLKNGNIFTEELSKTQKSCINQLLSIQDSAFDLIDLAMLGVLNGNTKSVAQLINDIENTQIEDVVQAANGISLDTVYFLKPQEKDIII